jgi:hypothetical protein
LSIPLQDVQRWRDGHIAWPDQRIRADVQETSTISPYWLPAGLRASLFLGLDAVGATSIWVCTRTVPMPLSASSYRFAHGLKRTLGLGGGPIAGLRLCINATVFRDEP